MKIWFGGKMDGHLTLQKACSFSSTKPSTLTFHSLMLSLLLLHRNRTEKEAENIINHLAPYSQVPPVTTITIVASTIIIIVTIKILIKPSMDATLSSFKGLSQTNPTPSPYPLPTPHTIHSILSTSDSTRHPFNR